MDWLFIIASIITLVAVAFLIGWSETNVRNPLKLTFIWIGGIVALLVVRYWDDHPFTLTLLAVAMLLRELEHVPAWGYYTAGAVILLLVTWYVFNLMGNAFIDLTVEVERTNARIASLAAKLDDISDRLAGTD
jgi:hypothetical protein